MTWQRLSDDLHGHPKVIEAGLAAMGLWALGLSHVGAYLSDGHLKRSAALRIAGSAETLEPLAARLVEVGLWEIHPGGDGWLYHDYLDYNPSRASVLVERERKREGGRKTAEARWGPRSAPAPQPPAATLTEPKAESPKGRGTRLPADWSPSASVLTWAEKERIDPTPAIDAFRDHWLASSSAHAVKRDWDAAFRSWLRKDIEGGRAVKLPAPEWSPEALDGRPADPEQVAQVQRTIAELTKSHTLNFPKKAAIT